MSTLAQTISTIMTNVQNAANFILSVVETETNEILSSITINEYGPPSDPPGLNITVKEFSGLYEKITDSIARMKELLKELPEVGKLLSDIEKQDTAYDAHIDAVDPYVDVVSDVMSSLPTYTAPEILGVSETVGARVTQQNVTTLTEATLPLFARQAFERQMNYRAGLVRGMVEATVAIADSQVIAKTQAQFDELSLKNKQALVDKMLEVQRTVLQSRAQKILPEVVLTPDQLFKLWEDQTTARSNIGVKYPVEMGTTKLGMQLSFAKKVADEYYRVAKELADFSIELNTLKEKLGSESRLFDARILQGLSSVNADVATACYSAVRTNFVLSEKAFTPTTPTP